MKTIEEMIKVMQAYKKGKKIEFTIYGEDRWYCTSLPCWNWDAYDYRIKKED